MTDKKSNNSNSGYLFENDFAYVNEEGEIFIKETKYFNKRVLAKIDPESAEDQIKKMEDAFSSIEKTFKELFDDFSAETEEKKDDLEDSIEFLRKEISKAEDIGDFVHVLNEAEEKIIEMKKTVTEASEENEKKESKEAKTSGISDDTEITERESEVSDNGKSDDSKDEVVLNNDNEETEISDEPESDSENDESAEEYYQALAEKAETLTEMGDWAYASMEFDNIDTQWEEGPDPEDADIKPYREKIDELNEQFEQKKRAHYEEQKRIKKENLEKKKNLLDQLEKIVEDEKWTHTREVGKIKGKWDSIKPVPAGEQEKLEKSFQKHLDTFDEHKIDRLVKKKQQEEDNLSGKLLILEKMEKFLKNVDEKANWKELEKKFSKFAKQFRKIGRVPADKNQVTWDRFHKAQDTFHSMRFKFDKKYRKNIEKFLSKKKKLIDEAEALLDTDNIAKAARQVNKLHRRWKKVGNLPQKDENELWDRFKAATDAFNEKKTDNIDVLRKQEDENYHQKIKLIEKAENIKDSEDWENTHNEYQKLMDQWKKVGPVTRKKSSKIWKKFKSSMDHFYDRRREHFKEVKEERKDNLKDKEEILEKLKDLKTHDDPIEAVNEAKPLQEEFKKAGYVPIKHKNRMWKEYRETCDVIYDRFRAAKSAAQVVGKENVENFSTDDIAEIRNMKKKADKLRKEIKKLSNELIQKKESLSYFKPTDSGSSLLDDVKKNIDNAENEIAEKEEELQELEIKIDKIKRGM